jgi:phospholipid/cholesterol/gamma-HCH transport system substrate-binding protein
MPSQQEVKWSQLKVGVVVLVASVILVTLLFLITSSSGFGIFSKKLTVTTYFENSAGLKEGAAVTLQGVTIGSVKAISVSKDLNRKLAPVRVVMKIDDKYGYDLHKDSRAALSTQGVLGDTLVDINSQTATGPQLQDGDELRTLETPSIQDVVKASQGTIEQLNVILAKMNNIVDNLETGKGSVGKLINDPELYNRLDSTVSELNKIEMGLNAGQGTVGKLLKDDQMYDRLNGTAQKLDQIATSLQAGNGTAGKLLTDDTLYVNLNQTLTRTNSLLADVQNGKGAAGMLINDPQFAATVRNTIDQANQIVGKVNQGEGTLGKLTTDDQAYTNLNKLLTESTLLVQTIRQDPKKYLTIHLKIF